MPLLVDGVNIEEVTIDGVFMEVVNIDGVEVFRAVYNGDLVSADTGNFVGYSDTPVGTLNPISIRVPDGSTQTITSIGGTQTPPASVFDIVSSTSSESFDVLLTWSGGSSTLTYNNTENRWTTSNTDFLNYCLANVGVSVSVQVEFV